MANPYLTLVNQKLANARQLLGLLDKTEDGLMAKQLNAALCDSVCVQLSAAYRCFLREVASHYRVAAPQQIETAATLKQALEGLSVFSPEASEWLALEQVSDEDKAWLADLLSCAANSLNPMAENQAPANAGAQLIDAVDLGQGQKVSLSVTVVSDWMAACTALIERQREGMQEF